MGRPNKIKNKKRGLVNKIFKGRGLKKSKRSLEKRILVLRREHKGRKKVSIWTPKREEKWRPYLPWRLKKRLEEEEKGRKKKSPLRVMKLIHFLRPMKSSQVIMDQLVNAGLHLGGNYAKWNPEMSAMLLGSRHSLFMIDLSESVVYLRRGLAYISRSIFVKIPILFVVSEKSGRDYLSHRLIRLGQRAIRGRYIPGTISNYRSVKEFKELPGVVCIGDTRYGVHAIRECGRLQIPFLGLCDSEMDPRWFCFPVFGNNDSVEGTQLLSGLVCETIVVGNRKLKKKFQQVKKKWNLLGLKKKRREVA